MTSRAAGRRRTTEIEANPAITYGGMKRSAEGIDHLRRTSRARSRALRRMRGLFPAEFEERWPRADRPKKPQAAAYNREALRALRAIAAAHPAEFRVVLLEELKREGLG